jgi:dTDP-4-amino-4,6-dideoxygalactose transaminase
MIPLAVPNLAGRESEYLQECISSTFVSTVGPFVGQFEEMVAQAAAAEYCVATSAGTTGLHAALLAVGVGRDDLVILPSLTFIASANAIAHCGAEPWLMDVDAESWTLDPVLLRRELATETVRTKKGLIHTRTGRRVAAIEPVFTLGMPADMDAIVDIAREYRLAVVVDAAAALGARYRGRPIGQLGADLTMFSFNGNKTVTAGGGGAVVGSDEALCRRVRHLTTTARVGSDYDHDEIGFNYRMTNLQAAVGRAQMENLDKFVARKHHIHDRYQDAFADLPGLRAFPAPNWAEGADWLSGFVLEDGDATKLRTRMRAAGIDARPFWKPMHLQVPFTTVPRSTLSVTDDIWQKIVTLPCSTGLTDAEINHVIAAVEAALDDK